MADNDQDWPPEPNRLRPIVIAEPQMSRGWSIFDGCLQIVGAGAVSSIVGGIVSWNWVADLATRTSHASVPNNDMNFGALFVFPALLLCTCLAFGLLGALSRSAWLYAKNGKLKAAAVQAILPGALLILFELTGWFFGETWDQFVDQLSRAWLPILWIGLLFAKGIGIIREIYADISTASR
jgi:hypothetical protein